MDNKLYLLIQLIVLRIYFRFRVILIEFFYLLKTCDLLDWYWIFGRLNRIENNGSVKVICFSCMKDCKETLQDSFFYNLSEREGRINYINFVKAVLSRDKQYITIYFLSSSRNLYFLTLNFRKDCLLCERNA